MKLLVLAQTPPPVHGQSVMVDVLVRGLPDLGVAVHHINLALSHSSADIGRWRGTKIFTALRCAFRAIGARFSAGCDTLYYVPAPPGKRGALYRDWAIMMLCRPFYRHLVLHWHAAGLGEWLAVHASGLERFISRLTLGQPDIAIVLANALRHDAVQLGAKRICVVPNGIPTPTAFSPVLASASFQLFFLGLCSEAKGLFAAVDAVIAANRQANTTATSPAFVLTAAGPFDQAASETRLRELCRLNPQSIRYAGFVGPDEKSRLFAACHAFIFPTRYAAEAQPLVVLEAFAHDRPVIATRWRSLPEMVPVTTGILVSPEDPSALVAALFQMRANPPSPGVCRAHFNAHYTLTKHLTALAAVFQPAPVSA